MTEIDQQLSQVSPEEKVEAMISKYGKNKGKLIANGKVWPTISYYMARDSWGEPERVDKNVEAWGTFTQWFYGDVTFFFKELISLSLAAFSVSSPEPCSTAS